MQNVNSIASRVAALFSATALTALLMIGYFTPAASAAIGTIA